MLMWGVHRPTLALGGGFTPLGAAFQRITHALLSLRSFEEHIKCGTGEFNGVIIVAARVADSDTAKELDARLSFTLLDAIKLAKLVRCFRLSGLPLFAMRAPNSCR